MYTLLDTPSRCKDPLHVAGSLWEGKRGEVQELVPRVVVIPLDPG
jgi:hypothetical protein